MNPTRCTGGRSAPEDGLSALLRRRDAITEHASERPPHAARTLRRRAVRGLTLVEIMVAFALLVVGVLGFSKVIVDSLKTNSLTRETTLATEAARRTMEALQAEPFDQVFALHNGSGADDPLGPGTAPGRHVQVAGLDALSDDADGAVGEILFPTPTPTSGVLREDLIDIALGTPRDLDGDAAFDALDHSGDYKILPVVVRMTWRGAAGPARLEFKTLLGGIQ